MIITMFRQGNLFNTRIAVINGGLYITAIYDYNKMLQSKKNIMNIKDYLEA